MCAHVNVCVQTPLHACPRVPGCLWDSSLPASSPQCVCPNAATPGQEVLSCFKCCDKKLCASERKEFAVTQVSFVLCIPLLTPPSPLPASCSPALNTVALAHRPLIQGWIEKVKELGKAKQILLSWHLRGTSRDVQTSVKGKSLLRLSYVRPPSTTALPVGAGSRARAVPKLPVLCCGLPGERLHPTVGWEPGVPGDVPSLTPLSHPPGCHDKAVLLYEYVGKRIVDLQHTEVPDAYRGRGIAKHLAKVRPQPSLLPWAGAVTILVVVRDPGQSQAPSHWHCVPHGNHPRSDGRQGAAGRMDANLWSDIEGFKALMSPSALLLKPAAVQ